MKYEEPGAKKAIQSLPCRNCGKSPPSDAAHVLSRGAGEVTILENLVPLCRFCHGVSHYSIVDKWTGIRWAALMQGWSSERCKTSWNLIQQAIYDIRQLDKGDRTGADAILQALRRIGDSKRQDAHDRNNNLPAQEDAQGAGDHSPDVEAHEIDRSGWGL